MRDCERGVSKVNNEANEYNFMISVKTVYIPIKDVRSHLVCADTLVIKTPKRVKEGKITIAHQ